MCKSQSIQFVMTEKKPLQISLYDFQTWALIYAQLSSNQKKIIELHSQSLQISLISIQLRFSFQTNDKLLKCFGKNKSKLVRLGFTKIET